MKKIKKNDIIAIVLCRCSAIPGAAVFGRLPDRIVTNWDINGKPGSTMPKAAAVFALPLMGAVIMFLLCLYLRSLEAKKQVGKLETVLLVFFPATFFLTQLMIILSAMGKLTDVPTAACLVVSVSMIVLGNYMPKVRKNWVVGIRTPHIVSDDEIWYRTHRFAGVIITLSGVAGAVISLLGHPVAVFVVIMVSVVLPVIYGEALYYRGRKG